MINAKDFALVYANKFNIPHKYAISECDKFWQVLAKLLYENEEDITIYGFGSFRQKILTAKKVQHPITKEITTIPQRRIIKFVQTSREH